MVVKGNASSSVCQKVVVKKLFDVGDADDVLSCQCCPEKGTFSITGEGGLCDRVSDIEPVRSGLPEPW